MMTDPRELARQDSGRIRQFRITISEHTNDSGLSVSLSWRTFPCAATKWDGHATYEVEGGERPVQSQEALRSVLSELSLAPWTMGPPGRR